MYYFKLTQSICILNTGILIAWFRNNFGSIGERQVRYMLSNNRKINFDWKYNGRCPVFWRQSRKFFI